MGRREADVASGRADAAGPEPGHVCGSVQNATAAGMLVRSALGYKVFSWWKSLDLATVAYFVVI